MWLRLRQIALVARELRPTLDALSKQLGIAPCFVDPGVKEFGLENTLMPIGNQLLEVVAPIREGTAGGRYLERRGGDGGYMVILQCDEHAPRVARAAALGVRKAFQFEAPGHYRCMQLHPRDTGGTFLEIDQQLGERANDVDGPWHPAGKNWQRARHTEVVKRIAAAELQSPEPEKLAARWAEILELPLMRDSAGRASIALSNATLRFVPATDGRGEGLAALDLEATDRARAGETLAVAGMRLHLV